MFSIDSKDFSCPKKKLAREETIISPYREYFSYQLPAEKQYWTMCGQCATVSGVPIIDTEFNHIISSNLISQDQFFGIEINKDIHKVNTAAYPGIKFINGDFYSTLLEHSNNDNFNPGIINVDLLKTPQYGASTFGNIMHLISKSGINNVMLIGNFLLRVYYNKEQDGNEIASELKNNISYKISINTRNWKRRNQYYKYYGTGKSNTVLGSVIYYLKD